MKENNRSRRNLLVIIGAIIAVITAAHYTIPHSVVYLHDISRRLYYLPIILAAFWFGRNGGILAALTVTILYFPHALFSWYGRNPRYLDNMIEIVFFNVVGYLVGTYIERKNAQRLDAEKNARELKQAYARLQDSTEKLIHMEEELRFADRLSLLGELSASLAHEVRNPLSGIRGAAEIFRKKFQYDDQIKEFVDIQLKEIARLNQVIENYLSLSKQDTKNFRPVNLKEVVDDTLKLMRISAKNQHINLSDECQGSDELNVYGDPLLLKQALLNLCLNAVHAMGSGGELTIGCSHEKGKISLRVQDTGSGIIPEAQEKIFDPFYTTRTEGTGLGLAIVKRIVEQHNGIIWFESSNKGTIFFIALEAAK